MGIKKYFPILSTTTSSMFCATDCCIRNEDDDWEYIIKQVEVSDDSEFVADQSQGDGNNAVLRASVRRKSSMKQGSKGLTYMSKLKSDGSVSKNPEDENNWNNQNDKATIIDDEENEKDADGN